jgi:hypothetical protein
MTRPEEALEAARRAVRTRRAEGGYAGVDARGELDASILDGEPSRELLSEWAVIEIDPGDFVYSTRAAGAPITAVKRLLVRLLRQYFIELEARQTRFNIAVLARLDALEERAARERSGPPAGEPPGSSG